MLRDLDRARIIVTNYHAFQRRETLELAKGNRALLQGRGPELTSRETEGQMLARVCPELMSTQGVLVLNDEAHHCYREKPGDTDEGRLTGDDRREAERNREAARVWISGLEAVQRKLGLRRVIDLSATPREQCTDIIIGTEFSTAFRKDLGCLLAVKRRTPSGGRTTGITRTTCLVDSLLVGVAAQ